MASKLTVPYNGTWTLMWVLWACLFYRAFPLSLPVLKQCLSTALTHWVKAGVYRNSRQARALSHRGATLECIVCVRKTGQLGQNSTLSSLNPVCGHQNGLHLLSRHTNIRTKYDVLIYVAYRGNTLSFSAVKQESHTRTHKWTAEESLRLPVSASALKAHTVNWGSGSLENPDWILILSEEKTAFKGMKMK